MEGGPSHPGRGLRRTWRWTTLQSLEVSQFPQKGKEQQKSPAGQEGPRLGSALDEGNIEKPGASQAETQQVPSGNQTASTHPR